jgi:hypothetical protein
MLSCRISKILKIATLLLVTSFFLFQKPAYATCILSKGCVWTGMCQFSPGDVSTCPSCTKDSDCTENPVVSGGLGSFEPYGTVKVNGANVAGNTPIYALVCGNVVNTSSTYWGPDRDCNTGAWYGGGESLYRSSIKNEYLCTNVREGAELNDEVRFCIGNCYASQTLSYPHPDFGWFCGRLDLSYNGACNPCWVAPPVPPPVCPGPKQEAGVGPLGIMNVWQYAPFTPSYTGEVYAVSIKAQNVGGALRSVTCKVTNAAKTADISVTASSAGFTNADGVQWREVSFNSNRFSLTSGTQYNVACRGPDAWASLNWIYLNEPVNGKTYRICQDPVKFSVTGNVWEDGETKDCTKNGAEANLSGWAVNLTGATTIGSTTDASGNYSIYNVPPGTYDACLAPPSGTWAVGCFREDGALGVPPVYPSFCNTITVSADKTVDWGARQRYPLSGRVCDDTVKASPSCSLAPLAAACNDPAIASAPAPGVRVTIMGMVGGVFLPSDITDASGNYSIPGLFEGDDYEVCITSKGGYGNHNTTCTNPIGGSVNCSTISGFSQNDTVDFGFTAAPSASWFQVINGDIHANGNFRSPISSWYSKPHPIIGVGADPAYGVISTPGTISINSATVSPDKDWQVAGYCSESSPTNPCPIDFDSALNMSESKFNALLAEAVPFQAQGNLTPNTIYEMGSGEIDVNIPGYKFSTPGSAIIVVDGNVSIKKLHKNPASQDNSTIIFLVKGDITIQPQLDSVDGILITIGSTGGVVTVDTANNQRDEKFTLNGMIYARNGINLPRDRWLIDMDTDPTETFVYLPYILNPAFFPDAGKKTWTAWREIE